MRERILEALAIADKIAFEFSGGNTEVPEEEQAILTKWIDSGLIKYVDSKKGKMSRALYFPVLEHEAWNGLTGGLWLKVMWYVMNKYHIDSGLSANSVNEYVSRPYKYGIEHGVMTSSYAGGAQVKEEADAWASIQEEIKDAGK